MDDNADPRERNADSIENEEIRIKDLILDDLIKMLTQMLDISPTDVRPETLISTELDLDSLQLYELVIDLEEAYDIRMPDERLDNIKTVNDVVELVYSLTRSDRH